MIITFLNKCIYDAMGLLEPKKKPWVTPKHNALQRFIFLIVDFQVS